MKTDKSSFLKNIENNIALKEIDMQKTRSKHGMIIKKMKEGKNNNVKN